MRILFCLMVIVGICSMGCGLENSPRGNQARNQPKQGQAEDNAKQDGKEEPEAKQEVKQEQEQPKAKQEEKQPKPEKVINYLTIENYYKIETGMTYKEVEKIIGPASEEGASNSFGQGTQFETKTVLLFWKGAWGANVNITFQNGKVVSKAQFGLPHGEPTPVWISEEEKKSIARAEEDWKKAEEIKRLDAQKKEELKAKQDKARWRNWTSSDGKFNIKAKFISRGGDKITLEKENGKRISIKTDELDANDLKWIINEGWKKVK
jgi:hypothetical protein